MKSQNKPDGKTKPDTKKPNNSILLSMVGSTNILWILLSMPILIVAPYMLKNVYDIIEMQHLARPDYEGPTWSHFSIMLIALPSIFLGKYLAYYFCRGFYEKNLPSKYQGEIRRIKLEKGCENIFKTLYFTWISLYGYFGVLRNLPYENPIIGNGEWDNYFINFPYVYHSTAVKYYCMVNLSYHTESTISLFLHKRNDFCEMFCHHTLTLLLVSIAYMWGYSNLSVMMMMILDNSDIFIGLIRVCLDITNNRLLILVAYIALMVSLLVKVSEHSFG